MTIAPRCATPPRDHDGLRLSRHRLLDHELALARGSGPVLEILPDWRAFPDPRSLRKQVPNRRALAFTAPTDAGEAGRFAPARRSGRSRHRRRTASRSTT